MTPYRHKILFLSLAILASACSRASPSANAPLAGAGTALPQVAAPVARFETTGWKIYTDSHLVFRYPPAWTIATTTISGGVSLSLFDPGASDAQDGPSAAIGIDYAVDRSGASIDRYIPDAHFRRHTEKATTTIGGHTAYVFQDLTTPENQDFRVVFADALVFTFTSNAWSINASSSRRDQILATFDTVLSTVQFSP